MKTVFLPKNNFILKFNFHGDHMKCSQELILKKKDLVKAIGEDKIKELHESNNFYEVITFAVPFVALFSIAYLLGNLSFGVLWVFFFFMQGMVLQWFAFLCHDICVHRRVVKHLKLNYILSIIIFLPLLISPTTYKLIHLKHHRTINDPDDPEIYKYYFDSFWKRLLLLTFLGQVFTVKIITQQLDIIYANLSPERTEKEASRIKVERVINILFFVSALVLSYFSSVVLYGYLLPLLIVMPLWSVLRLILEHAATDPTNPLACSTYYKTNFITSWMFFCDSGDCHLVHHLFPGVPSYNINRALKLIRPYLEQENIIEYKSILSLCYMYFINIRKYCTNWHLSEQ